MSKDGQFFLIVAGCAIVILAGIFIFTKTNKSPKPTADLTQLASFGHKIGNDDADITIVEFSDFQCPACASTYPTIKQLLSQDNGIRFIYRHFPLSIHKNAELAAIAAEAAASQSNFWSYHDLLFETQSIWSTQTNSQDHFIKLADQLNLDIDQFKQDLAKREFKDKVKADLDYANALSLNQTPTFFVNNQRFEGAKTLEQWQEIIRQLRRQ